MPLREDLLQPIEGDNPSGKNLRYDRVYDQIKEARTEDDETLPAGAWERQAKRADLNLVMKVAGDVLATKSKDLQVAAWLGEAHIRKEGPALLAPVLTLILDLHKQFWETIYPEIDEGDVGLRAMPVEWAANRYATLVYEFPITKSGVTFFTYKAGRAIGYATDAQTNEVKKKARDLAIKRGQLTAEEVDEGIAASPKSFYATLDAPLQSARDVLEEVALYCEEQYGSDGPSFRKLRDSLDEVHNLVSSLLAEKRKLDPDPIVVEEVPEAEAEAEAGEAEEETSGEESDDPGAVSARRSLPTGGPTDKESAYALIAASAEFIGNKDPSSSVAYLLGVALRMGETRNADLDDFNFPVAPPTDVRRSMRRLAQQQKWDELLKLCVHTLPEPCGRAWLDIHRYVWTAAKGLGNEALGTTVISTVRTLLSDFPALRVLTLTDDTAAANPDTQQWIDLEVLKA